MKTNRLSATGVALCCAFVFHSVAADTPRASAASKLGMIDESKVASIKVGTTTRSQVQAMLGTPWKLVQFNDDAEAENEIWEYRSADATGQHVIHIEFDNKTQLVTVLHALPVAAAQHPATQP